MSSPEGGANVAVHISPRAGEADSLSETVGWKLNLRQLTARRDAVERLSPREERERHTHGRQEAEHRVHPVRQHRLGRLFVLRRYYPHPKDRQARQRRDSLQQL